jgi:hypothetical protein
MAPRSERVVLSRPSSRPGHSDSPNARDHLLPVSSGLQAADRRRSAIPRVPCASVSPTVAGNRHRLRPGEMRVPALPPDLTGYIDEERPCEHAGGSGATFMSPSPHAIGLTPGSRQVRVPFASLSASAFPKGVEGRRISWFSQVSPATGLSRRFLSGHKSRSCTVRVMLRPADLASIPDRVRPVSYEPSRYRVGARSAQVLPPERAPSLCS